MRQSGAGEAAQLLGGNGPLLVRLVREAGADTGEYLVEVFLGAVAVQADHEGVAEAALVRGVGGGERGLRGLRRTGMQTGGGLVGECLGEVGGERS